MHNHSWYFSGAFDTVAINGNNSPYNEGDLISLTCDVTGGDPEATVNWYKNGGTTPEATDTESLAFLANRADNLATFTCEATNTVDTQTDTTTIQISCMYR